MKHGFLILAFIICFKPAFPFLDYAANYDYISKVLCINRDAPEVQCYGKCYLMKAVKAEAENDHKDKSAAKFESQLLYPCDTEEFIMDDIDFSYSENTFYFPGHYTSLIKEGPFKPPISLL